jgi:hypothetical protein
VDSIQKFVVGYWFFERPLLKNQFFLLTTKNHSFNNEELTFFPAIATGGQRPCFVHLSPCRTKTPDNPKLPVLLIVNLAPSKSSLLVVCSCKSGC